MVWYSHLFQNFPQFIVIHTIKGFGIVNKAEIDVFMELSSLYKLPRMVSWSGTWPILTNIPCALEKQMRSAVVGWSVL